LPAIANQRQRQQAHFGLELPLHIGDDGGALLAVEYGGANNRGRWPDAGGAGRREILLFALQVDFCAEGRQFLLWVHVGPCRQVTSEAKKQNGKCGGDDYRDSNTTVGRRTEAQFGSRAAGFGSVLDRCYHGQWKGNGDAVRRAGKRAQIARIPRVAVGASA
jgi:hypothetical protein